MERRATHPYRRRPDGPRTRNRGAPAACGGLRRQRAGRMPRRRCGHGRQGAAAGRLSRFSIARRARVRRAAHGARGGPVVGREIIPAPGRAAGRWPVPWTEAMSRFHAGGADEARVRRPRPAAPLRSASNEMCGGDAADQTPAKGPIQRPAAGVYDRGWRLNRPFLCWLDTTTPAATPFPRGGLRA